MSVSKRDFEETARIIARIDDPVNYHEVLREFVVYFKSANPNFSTTKFIDRADVEWTTNQARKAQKS